MFDRHTGRMYRNLHGLKMFPVVRTGRQTDNISISVCL